MKPSITEKRRNKGLQLKVDLKFHKTYVCEEDQSKALDISSATARVAQDLLKALVILSDTTVRRSAVDLEGLKPYWEPEKKPHFSR